MDSVQYLVQDLSQSWDSLSPVLKALESKLKTQSKEQHLDDIKMACLNNGLQMMELKVCVQINKLADFPGPMNFGDMGYTTDKTDPKFAFMKNIMVDIVLRPDATALNPHAYDQLADKWDLNGPGIPQFVPSIEILCLKN
ncbi:unnamed protein product [Medioppia subpectinata]|uniref:Uncharacterized protein n=1 Tax=Medioppia subpectinata TaxID=1979941 RepID=A0A7R9QAC5_9ACAR|nr:unnamed protein product [Medioppia subpectinata]CAG2117046.1 unnamed protein product [Medioppia subpectinata]